MRCGAPSTSRATGSTVATGSSRTAARSETDDALAAEDYRDGAGGGASASIPSEGLHDRPPQPVPEDDADDAGDDGIDAEEPRDAHRARTGKCDEQDPERDGDNPRQREQP